MKRILSLLPSATEIIYALGAQDSLVGVTHECDFPLEACTKPRVTSATITPALDSKTIDQLVREQLDDTGSLYALDMELVRTLQPEVVLTQQLCTVCAVGFDTVRSAMQSLSEPPEVVNLEPHNLQEVFESIQTVAELLGCRENGIALIDRLTEKQGDIPKLQWSPQILFLEWLLPPFSAGHWMHELITAAGAVPILSNPGAHSRELSWDQIRRASFEAITISCCGFSVERGLQDLQISADLQRLLQDKPSLRLILFDGNHYFSRPGPRLIESAELLNCALAGISPDETNATIPLPYIEIDLPTMLSQRS